MGHALNNTLQDILCRYKRMDGFRVLWIPGTDHAGIATQNVVERRLAAEGLNRNQLGREKFIERVWSWKQEAGDAILHQLRALGVSCDWDHERFTMDEGLSRAVREAFVRLWDDKLLYRAQRLINWCPRCKTALSDIEVIHQESDGNLWHIGYPLAEDPSRELVVATTRPETMLGDTAVAVHPDDERYQNLIGKNIRLPLSGRIVPLIADPFVDREFGTGALKITPGHDFNDFEIGERFGLDRISIFDAEGRIDAGAFLQRGETGEWIDRYHGKDRFEARSLVVADLKDKGFLRKIEPHKLSIGPLLSLPNRRRAVSHTPVVREYQTFGGPRHPGECARAIFALFPKDGAILTLPGWKTSKIGVSRDKSGGDIKFPPGIAAHAIGENIVEGHAGEYSLTKEAQPIVSRAAPQDLPALRWS